MMSTSERPVVVMIPGIGGHPLFHESLVDALSVVAELSTWPHGDFNASPFHSLDQHVELWRKRIESLATDHVILVAVSFGAHIAARLPRIMATKVDLAILVSRWPIGVPERLALGLLASMPTRFAAAALQWFLFRWSDVYSDDVSDLELKRQRLYDDLALVSRRLLARLLSCRDVSMSIEETVGNARYVFGASELARIRDRQYFGRSVEVERCIVPGGHSISISSCPVLAACLVEMIVTRPRQPTGKSL